MAGLEELIFGIVANNRADGGDPIFRKGAKVVVVSLMGDRLKVKGLSLGGRQVHRIVPIKRLENFRAKWMKGGMRKTREEAEAVAKNLGAY